MLGLFPRVRFGIWAIDELPAAACSRGEFSWVLHRLAAARSAAQDSVRLSITGLGASLLCIWDQSLKYQLAFLSLLTFLKHLNNFFFPSVKINQSDI